MPVKLEWERGQGEFIVYLPEDVCGCFIRVSMYGDPDEPIIYIGDIRGGKLIDGSIGITRVINRSYGSEGYIVDVSVEDARGVYEQIAYAEDLETAVYAALVIAKLLWERARGRIESFDTLLDAITDVIEYNLSYVTEEDEENEVFEPIPFTPAEARKAIHVIEMAVEDLKESGDEIVEDILDAVSE